MAEALAAKVAVVVYSLEVAVEVADTYSFENLEHKVHQRGNIRL